MRESLAVSGRVFGCALPKMAVLVVAMIATLCCGTGAVGAETASGNAAVAKRAKKKTTTLPEAGPIALPNGHIGQEYGTKILGVTGIDVGDASCSAVVGLPRGLELNCDKMTIHGHPLETVDRGLVSFTVSDSEGHSLPLQFELSVVEGMDVVRVGVTSGRPAPVASPVSAPAVRPAPAKREVAAVVPATRPAGRTAAPVVAPATVAVAAPVAHPAVASVALKGNPSVVAPASAAPVAAAEDAAPPAETASDAAGGAADPPADAPLFVAPSITSPLKEGATVIAGQATKSTSTLTVKVAVISYDDYHDVANAGPTVLSACIATGALKAESGRVLELTGSPQPGLVTTDTTGAYTATLANPLVEGQRLRVVEVFPAETDLSATNKATNHIDECTSLVSEVKGQLDWGRIHADFTAGVLISNDSSNSTAGASGAGAGNFSEAHQFYALTVEKSWSLPGCYLRTFAHTDATLKDDGTPALDANNKPVMKPYLDQCYAWRTQKLSNAKKTQHLSPGFSTYFQARLTAIPVSTVASNNTTTTAAPTTPAAGSALRADDTTAGSTTTASMPSSNLLTTAQTAKVEVGAYLPFLITRWDYNQRPNALFIAPLAKVGFNTVTGPSTVNTLAPNNSIQSQTFEQVYNFWSYGARIGHMELARTQNKAPETYSYLDISIGPYSNLQSYICRGGTTGSTPAPNSECSVYPKINNPIDSRKRLYRLDIEGLLKIPKTAFYVGLNANIGQKTLGATHLDQGFAAPDDLRFFFGTKFDLASVLSKFNLAPQ